MSKATPTATPTIALAFTAAAILLGAGGCASWPGLDNPQISLAPYLALYTLEGQARMQSAAGGAIVNNAAMPIATLGLRERDDDWGGTLAIGDGFSGFELSYLRLDMDDTETGTLTADFGAVPAGTVVNATAKMDEFRFGYVAQAFLWENDQGLYAKLGGGLTLVHRELDFVVQQEDGPARQAIRAKDVGLPYLKGRLDVGYRQFGIDVDYAWNPDLELGGDFSGTLQDLEVVAHFTLEDQDLTLYAGYRRSDLPASSREGPFRYDADFELEGFFLGIRFSF